jgi:FAD/FMN-containing dehydrogenase
VSGGHASFAGASSIDEGITITMQRFNGVHVSSDMKSASIGSGLRWGEVYQALEPYNLTAIGGRVSDIGVGGLILGGGISFFSSRYGWACDNVINYELVTANGAVIQVNYTGPYKELFYALRGGGNNFGIVTRFDVKVYTQGTMWGGNVIYSANYTDQIIDAMVDYSKNEAKDVDSALIVPFIYTSATGFLVLGQLEHARPQPAAGPEIFKKFKAIPPVIDMTQNDSQYNITAANNMAVPAGNRQTYWTASYKVDAQVLKNIAQTFNQEVQAISNVTGLQATMPLAFISKPAISFMSSNGGNALGLTEADGPLILLNLAFTWSNAADDYTVLKACENIVDKTVAYAKSKGLDHPYLYMNYASQFQNVVPTYGKDNLKKLKTIQKHFDPQGVFKTLLPGGFKLEGAPAGTETLPVNVFIGS